MVMGTSGGFGTRLEHKWFIQNKSVNSFIQHTYQVLVPLFYRKMRI